jgi:hypothetical protein
MELEVVEAGNAVRDKLYKGLDRIKELYLLKRKREEVKWFAVITGELT